MLVDLAMLLAVALVGCLEEELMRRYLIVLIVGLIWVLIAAAPASADLPCVLPNFPWC